MPRKPKRPREVLAPVPTEVLDHFAAEGPLTAAEIESATRRLKKALIERARGAELSHHLGYAPGATKPADTSNHRNGASSADDGRAALDAFAQGPYGRRFPMIVTMWRRAWPHVMPFYAFPLEVRRILYTTNALESVHARIRKIIKTRGVFPSDDAAAKLIWLALRNATQRWTLPLRTWKAALVHFSVVYEDRFRLVTD